VGEVAARKGARLGADKRLAGLVGCLLLIALRQELLPRRSRG